MGRDQSAWGLNRLERLTLRKQEQNPVTAHIKGSHPVVLMNAGQSKDIPVKGRSLFQVRNVQGSFKNSVELGHA
jgi:hypothetical protein